MPQQRLHWFFRYKLHHLFFWAVYHFCWWTISSGSVSNTLNNLVTPPYTLKYGFYVVIQALGVYFCLYYLVPRFLEKRKYLPFLGLCMLSIGLMSVIIASGYYVVAYVFDRSVTDLFKADDPSLWFFFKANALPSCIAAMTLGMSIKLTKSYLNAQQRQQELEKEKLETELKFLKSQFNPHFLFNTINSIFVLINKNTTQASDSLAKFSNLLRYQLYECNETEIPLNRELAYLESFIELERLRLDQHFEIRVELPKDQAGNLNIAPFLLMPFVENAFKHVSKNSDHLNWIKIKISLKGDELTYVVSNSVTNDIKANDAVNYGGLGLLNVQRRLDLLYPNRYQLTTHKTDSTYLVNLILTLATATAPSHELAIKEE